MRKLLLSALTAAGLTLVGVNSFAVDVNSQDAQLKVITGEVTDVMDSTLKVKDEMGKTHTIRVAGLLETGSLELEEVKVGDDVHIEFEYGQAIAIHKTEDMKGSGGASEEGKGG